MAQIGTLNTFEDYIEGVQAGDAINSLPLQQNYVEITDKYNSHDSATTGVHGVTSTILSKEAINTYINKYIPVGWLRYIWDNNDSVIRALLDSGKFVEMDGLEITDTESIFNHEATPDLTNVFIVGMTSGDSAFVGLSTHAYPHVHSSVSNASHSLASHTHSQKHKHNLGSSGWVNFSTDATTVIGYKKASNIVGDGDYSSLLEGSGSNTARVFDEGKRVPLAGYTTEATITTGPQTGTTLSTYTDGSIGSSSLTLHVNDIVTRCKRRCYLRIK